FSIPDTRFSIYPPFKARNSFDDTGATLRIVIIALPSASRRRQCEGWHLTHRSEKRFPGLNLPTAVAYFLGTGKVTRL
ncbi:MAG: hypothetical protein OEV48_20375, partial [Acidobacteriota bacterium]|nr:hypothetical protein [Acidobacteriota bacterium]